MARRRGFTLVEIMIVVLIIGILMSIAIPQFVRARENSQQKTCVANLRLLDQAKELYTYKNGLNNGDAIDGPTAWTDYSKNAFPTCPAGGTYTVGLVGETPSCSVLTGNNPHVYNP